MIPAEITQLLAPFGAMIADGGRLLILSAAPRRRWCWPRSWRFMGR